MLALVTDDERVTMPALPTTHPGPVSSREGSFPATAVALRDIRAFIVGLANVAGICGEDLDKIVLMVNEAATNAVEHSGSGTVRVLWEDQGSLTRITVADDGVFDLRRHPAACRGFGMRTVIGLADEVTVSAGKPSKPGTTLRFLVSTTTRTATGKDATGKDAGVKEAPDHPRLLLLDADRFSGHSLKCFLEAEGYDVTLVPTFDDARNAIAHHPLDLVIMDLTTLRGLADKLCSELWQHARIPVLAMSVFTPRMLPQGIDRFIHKPAHPLEVLMAVRQLLARPVQRPAEAPHA